MDNAVHTIAFYIFAGLALGSALGVVISTNIVRTAIYLLGTLASAAGLYFLLDANLLAAIQLIVYAGGTLVLIIFGIMLTSKSPWIKYNPTRWQIGGAIVLGLVLAFGLCSLLLGADWQSSGTLTESPKVATAGKALLTDYLVPFEAASVLLLVVMIAAAYLARPEK